MKKNAKVLVPQTAKLPVKKAVQSPKGKTTMNANMAAKNMPVPMGNPPSGGKQHKPGSDVQQLPKGRVKAKPSSNMNRIITRQSEEAALTKKMAGKGLRYMKGLAGKSA